MEAPQRVVDRVTTKVQQSGECLISLYSVGSHGYAQVGWSDGGRKIVTVAHRVVWVASNGPISDGYTVDHLCKQKRCVNLRHLRLIENFENARRTSGRDWALGTCAHGHGNEHIGLINGGRKRACLICRADWQRKYEAKRARVPASSPTA